MPSLISPADVNAVNGGGGLSNSDLQAVIDREEAELIRRFGAHYQSMTTVSQTRPGGRRSIYLTRGIGTVSSVSEYLYLGDTAPQALVENSDYVTWADEGRLERLGGCWGSKVTVVFIPVDDTYLRKQVLLELVRVAVSESPFQQESVKGVEDSYSYMTGGKDWMALRETQYARLLMSPL